METAHIAPGQALGRQTASTEASQLPPVHAEKAARDGSGVGDVAPRVPMTEAEIVSQMRALAAR